MRLMIRAVYFVLLIMPLLVVAAEPNGHAKMSKHLDSCGDHNCTHQRHKAASSKGTGSTGKWKDETTPKRSWACTQIKDIESASYKCDMCEANLIRYVHTMTHRNHDSLDVGCICAGHMSGDMAGAKNREKYFSKRASRRKNFTSLQRWKTSTKGNQYLKNYKNHLGEKIDCITITKSKYGQYSAMIGGNFMNTWHSTISEAKLAAFDILWPTQINCG